MHEASAYRELSERRPDTLGAERQIAQPLTGGMREGIGDGGDHWALRAFPRAERFLVRPIDHLDVDLRHLRHGQDWIGGPVARDDAVAVETHGFVQGPAR